ncbi:MAG: hypothetical protein AAGI90_02145 [Chlamydiota bacterium]
MHCPSCKQKLDFPCGKVPFRATCPFCFVELHTCVHCSHHNPSLANQCKIKTSLFVRDRSAYNFCEDFCLKSQTKSPSSAGKKTFENLFGEEPSPEPLKKGKAAFDDLFID